MVRQRKFNSNQSGNKKPTHSYSPPSRNNKIQKDTKKDNIKPNTNVQKPQSIPLPSNSKFPPPPPVVSNPIQNKSLTEAGKNNLAKLASINKLMGVNMDSASKPAKLVEAPVVMNPKLLIKKPNIQQVSQVVQGLKDLQKLLDSYDELQMDQNCNLKSLLQFLQQRKVNNEQEKQQKCLQ